MKIGFIGTGNMATAIIKGLLSKQIVEGKNIFVSSDHQKTAENFAQTHKVTACQNNHVTASQADILILAVKPNILPIVLPEIKDTVEARKPLLVSIAAGVTLASLTEMIGLEHQPIVRVMPNVNVGVQAGVCAVCHNALVSEEQIAEVTTLLEAVGSVYPLAEKDFSTFVGISGSSPAYTYMFIDAMSRAAVLNGMPKKLATEIAAKAVLGSAKRLLEGTETPWELVDQVSSPGGTTVEGVVTLEETGFISSVIAGVDATIKKDQEMQGK